MQGCNQQLQHGFTKNAKVSPNLTVAHISITIALWIGVGSHLMLVKLYETWMIENICFKFDKQAISAQVSFSVPGVKNML